MSARPGIACMACTSWREMRSISEVSVPRTLIWIGFWPKGPASKKPKVMPGTCCAAARASRSTWLKLLATPSRSFT
jgi:hypothetical protein